MSIAQSPIADQYCDIVDATNIVSKSDTKGIITYVNGKFVEISGYTQEELLGKPHSILRDPKQPSTLFENLWNTIQAKKVWHGVVTNIRKDFSRYTVNASIFPIVDENGDITEYISIKHDITKLVELNSKVDVLREYNIQQEHIARDKLEAGIVNDMSDDECKVLYRPSDILSGDFYSIYKRDDGSIFIYLMDGQGHGISPALTVFAISSMMNQAVYGIDNLHEVMEQLAPNVKNFLGEIEQLSYTMIMISSDKRSISYASAGMYPFLIKAGEKIIRVKANNTPFMNFSGTPDINTLEIGKWESLMIYSDGMIEHENPHITHYAPETLIKQPYMIDKAIEDISTHTLDDDVTMLYLKNSI